MCLNNLLVLIALTGIDKEQIERLSFGPWWSSKDF